MNDEEKILIGVFIGGIVLYFIYKKNNNKTVAQSVGTNTGVTSGVTTSGGSNTVTNTGGTSSSTNTNNTTNNTASNNAGSVPATTQSTPTKALGDGTYSTDFAVTNITPVEFMIVSGFDNGVDFDVSLDGGKTYPYTNLTSENQYITGLKPNTTYQVVRRMYGTVDRNPVVILPATTVTTMAE